MGWDDRSAPLVQGFAVFSYLQWIRHCLHERNDLSPSYPRPSLWTSLPLGLSY
jgi:hypothetical protein